MTTRLPRFTACAVCKRDHKKCDGKRPCARCASQNICGECVDVEKPTKKSLKRKLVDREGQFEHATELQIAVPNFPHVIPPTEGIRRTQVPPNQNTSMLPPGLLENILKEVQKLGKTTTQLKEEQETIKREIEQWTLIEENVTNLDVPPRAPQKRIRHESPSLFNEPAAIIASPVFPPLLVQTSWNSEFVIKDPLKPFAVLRPNFSGPEFKLFPVTANAPMAELLGFPPDDDGHGYDCTTLVPACVPANAVARAEMLTGFLKRSAEPHSPIFHQSITYFTRDGRYIDADTRKQFFYNESGEPMFVIVCVDRVYVPSHYLYHLTETDGAVASRFQLSSSMTDGILPQEGDVNSSPAPSPVPQHQEKMGDMSLGEDLFALLDFYQGFPSY